MRSSCRWKVVNNSTTSSTTSSNRDTLLVFDYAFEKDVDR